MSLSVLYYMISSHRYCFIENLAKEGLISPSGYVVLDEWFKWITSNLDTGGDLIGKYDYPAR
jgi:hypothetical protein